VKPFGFAFLAVLAAAAYAGCASQPPPPPAPVILPASLTQSTPPPIVTTPVPVVHAHSVPGSGRPDPFVALYGPPTTASATPKGVAVSTFPRIPTLPGFSNGQGGVHTIWDGVSLTGIVRSSGSTGIVQVDENCYIVRQGDVVAGRFRVTTIGPDFVTLASTSTGGERTFSLGG